MKKETIFPHKKGMRAGKAHNRVRRYLLLPVMLIILLCAVSAAFLLQRLSRPEYLKLSAALETPLPCGTQYNVQPALSVPTQITKIGEDYFLVDCYHDQILTSTDAAKPLTQWLVLTDQISRGHTIAGDGTVYLADDTENNRILIFEKREGAFYLTQTFEDTGIRPHYVVYDEDACRFYALSSMTGELYVFFRPHRDSASVALEKVLSIPELDGIYVRSFTIDGDDIYFVSGNCSILRASKKDLSVLEAWPVPEQIAGMIQLTKIQNYYYITVSTDLYGSQDFATILRVKELSDLADGSWEDIYSSFIGGGTPYYISSFDGHYYLTEHRIPGHGVWQFDVDDDQLVNIRTLFP